MEGLSEESQDRETKRFQKTRKATARMEGLSEERRNKGRGRIKVESKEQRWREVEGNSSSSRRAMC